MLYTLYSVRRHNKPVFYDGKKEFKADTSPFTYVLGMDTGDGNKD